MEHGGGFLMLLTNQKHFVINKTDSPSTVPLTNKTEHKHKKKIFSWIWTRTRMKPDARLFKTKKNESE